MIEEYVICPQAEEMGCNDHTCTHAAPHEENLHCTEECPQRVLRSLATHYCVECRMA